MACTGIEFCKLAIGETKGRAQWLYTELAARLPDFDEDLRIHVNGCPNSCARFQVADIGLMSALQPRPDGTKSDAFLVHLGGGMGEDAAFGRKVKGVKVYAEDAADYVEALLVRYGQPAAGRRLVRQLREPPGRRRAGAFRRAAGHGGSAMSATPRAVPFYCPFCGEQDTAARRPRRAGAASRAPASSSSHCFRRRCGVMAEREPIHEPTLPLFDDEAAWVHEAADRFEDANAQELLAWALEQFHPRLAISAAGGVDGMAIIDMAWRINPDVRVFTLDTGRLPAGDLHALRRGPRALRHRRGVRVPRARRGGVADDHARART